MKTTHVKLFENFINEGLADDIVKGAASLEKIVNNIIESTKKAEDPFASGTAAMRIFAEELGIKFEDNTKIYPNEQIKDLYSQALNIFFDTFFTDPVLKPHYQKAENAAMIKNVREKIKNLQSQMDKLTAQLEELTA
jgi:hypothetical protein